MGYGPLGNTGAFPSPISPQQVYAISVQGHASGFCPPPVYTNSMQDWCVPRLLPTAGGVCNQRVGGPFMLLPTTCVWDQHFGAPGGQAIKSEWWKNGKMQRFQVGLTLPRDLRRDQLLPGVGKGTLGSMLASPNVCIQCEKLLSCIGKLHVYATSMQEHTSDFWPFKVCVTSMLVSFGLLPTASVFYQHLHPLGFTPLQQVYGNTAWKFVLEFLPQPQLENWIK